jgi:hypothetical protein
LRGAGRECRGSAALGAGVAREPLIGRTRWPSRPPSTGPARLCV